MNRIILNVTLVALIVAAFCFVGVLVMVPVTEGAALERVTLTPPTLENFDILFRDLSGWIAPWVFDEDWLDANPGARAYYTLVNIPDAALRGAINYALGSYGIYTVEDYRDRYIDYGGGERPDDAPITLYELRSLTGLWWSAWGTRVGYKIRNLAGLEYATNLTELRLGSNRISDVTPLAGLTSLSSLDLSGNWISDVTPLAGLTSLTSLNLMGNRISDVTPLAGLTGLTDLRLGANWISDVTPLAGLTNLRLLILHRNSVSDVKPLAGLTNLTGLFLGNNEISDVKPLDGLTRLTGLSLGNNEISNIAPLTGLTSLSSLDLRDNPLNYQATGNIETLRSSGVKWIGFTPTVDDVPIQDALLRERINKALGSERAADAVITSAEMLSLTRLNARGSRGSRIVDLRGLSYAVNLTRLDLADNNVTDVSPLSGLTKLEHLYFAGNHNLADITVLSGLSELYYLDIWRSRVSDLSVLSNFKKLGRLQARATGITDVSVVAQLPEYYIFALGYNGIRDLAPFVANPGVGWWDAVYLLGNPLSYDAIYSQIPVLKARGTQVTYTNREPGAPVKSGGDAQTGAVGTTLASPLVVQVNDTASRPKPFEAVPITWAVTGGGGTLQNADAKTDVNGLASAELLLGSGFGTNTVTASLSHNGTTRTLTFTATADPLVQVQEGEGEGEGEGDDGGDDEPVVVPRTPAVRDAIDNLLGSTAQWDDAKEKLKRHNDLTGILVASRKLLNHALDDNSEEYLEGKINGVLGSVPVSNPAAAIRVLTDVIHTVKDAVDDWKIREVLAANNDEIRAHTNSERVQRLVNAINTTYAAYAERWNTLNDRYLKHLPDGHGDKRDYVKRSNDEADKWVRPGAAVNLMMSCYNGCGVTFLTGSSFAGEAIKSSTRAFELARDGHKTGICNVKPHVNLRYYVCRGGSCPRSEEHSVPRPRPVPVTQPVRQTQAPAAERQPAAELEFELKDCENAMPYPGKLYEIKLTVKNLSSNGKIEASLSGVTNWRGDYGNYPLADGDPSPDPDLKLLESDNDSKWKPYETDGLKLYIDGRTSSSFDGNIVIRCYDSAAYGVLTVTVITHYPSAQIIKARREIPCDTNGNQISDAWSHDASYLTFADAIDARSDAEEGPSGNPRNGDGFTAFEEYRGFKTGSGAEPTRLDPTQKEVFIVVGPSLPGIGHAAALQTNATIKPVTIDSAYVNDWDKDGESFATGELHGLMNINNIDPKCRVQRVYAIRVISATTTSETLGKMVLGAPQQTSLGKIYRHTDAIEMSRTIGHEIAHSVNLDHCPRSEYTGAGSPCLMRPEASIANTYATAHRPDYDLVHPAGAPQPGVELPLLPSSGDGDDDDDGDGDGDGDGDDGSGDSGGGDTAPAAPERPTTPTTPTTVACGNRWTGKGRCSEGGRAASRYEHQTTCSGGHRYWGCNPTADEYHKTRVCGRSGCGRSYTKCKNGPRGNNRCPSNPGGWHEE